MSILKLAMEAPKLCGAKSAERFGKVAELVYKHELTNDNSVFARNEEDEEDPKNRMLVAFAWKEAKEHKQKKQYIMDLIEYAMELHYQAEHGSTVDVEPMKSDLMAREPLYQDVAAIQPVASVQAAWLG